MHLNIRTAGTIVLGAIVLAGCSTQGAEPAPSAEQTPSAEPSQSSEQQAPLTEFTPDPSCPATAELAEPAERIVTSDAAAAAFLIELGAGDKIVGTAGPDFKNDFDGELRKQLDAIPVIDEGQGAAEAVIKQEPDLATSISAMSFGKFDGTPTPEQLAENDIAVIAACDGVSDKPTSDIESAYAYITSLGDALDAQDEAATLVAELRDGVSKAGADQTDKGVLLYSTMPGGPGGLMTNGGTSFANGIVTLAGGKNIAEGQMKRFASLSAEEVAESDPELIVVVTGFSPESDDAQIATVLEDPLVASTTAVKTKNVIAVPQRLLLSPSLKNAEAVEAIAQALAKS